MTSSTLETRSCTSARPRVSDRTRDLLERALTAEEGLERALARIADLELRMRGALNADPTTASRALSWVGRAELAEGLLGEAMRFVRQRSLNTQDFPPGWVARTEAQLASVVLLKRDQERFAERPDDDYWTTYVDPKGRAGVVRDTERP